MTQIELKTKIDALQTECNSKILALKKDYAFANNPHKVGDTITDHQATIVIDKISYSPYSRIPEMKYEGFCVNKNGTIGKKTAIIYQQNIKN